MKLTTIDLTKKYRRGEHEFDAVAQANIALYDSEIVSIIGPSGCGKSTLLGMMTGMIRPSGGKILLDDKDLASCSDNEWADIRNQTLSYIPQGSSLLNNLNILDNICMPIYLSKKTNAIHQKASELLEKVGLCGAEYEFPSNLSGGEVRRVAILRSLINDPKMLIADEPTGSLDPESAKIIMELFREISSNGVSILISTHDYEFLNYSHRTYKMNQGLIQEH